MGALLWFSKLRDEGTREAEDGETTAETDHGSLTHYEVLGMSETD